MLAAVALTFVADGTLELDQPVGGFAPGAGGAGRGSLDAGPVDDTVPASRAITLRHLLTSTNGHRLSVRLLGAGRSTPRRAAPAGSAAAAACAAAGRVDGDPRRDPAAPPARRRVHVQHRIRHPRRARRPGRRAPTLPELMATRLFEPLGMTEPGSPSRPGPTSDTRPTTATARTGSSSRTVPTGSGRRCRRSRRVPVASCRPWPTSWRSSGCCWPAAATCCPPTSSR